MDETKAKVPDLLRENVSLLYWLGQRMLRPVRRHTKEDVEEFVSELTLMALQKQDQYDPAKGKFSTWMHWQARCVRTRLGQKKKLVWTPSCRGGEEVSAIDFASHDVEPSSGMQQRENRELIRESFERALMRLPGNQRSVARSVLVRGTSLRDLAAMRGVAKNAVDQTYNLARRRLRRYMAKDFHSA